MARNLISLSALDCDGYGYAGGNRRLKISKGSLIIMIGNMNTAKLYVLRGSTSSGTVTAAIANDDPNKTNLWHMRLGHMSELGMTELIKRELLKGCKISKLHCEHCIFGKRGDLVLRWVCAHPPHVQHVYSWSKLLMRNNREMRILSR